MNRIALTSTFKCFSKSENIQLFFLLGVVALIVFYMPEVFANQLDQVGTRLSSKISDISKVVKTVAGAGFAVGVLWIVISLLKGEPNYRYAFVLILSGTLLFFSGVLVNWATQ